MIRVLSFHAAYRCRDSGACCTAGWPIPVEADRADRIHRALRTGMLRPEVGERQSALESPAADAPDVPTLVNTLPGHGCVFYRAHGADRCAIHRALGHEALPLACRQFPRVSLHDPRGTSVTLSHYCPTAAAMLNDDGPVSIVTSAPAFPATAEYVGLDATNALPPLLRPDLLMDWEAWWECEMLSVDLLANTSDTPRVALNHLAHIVEHVRAWRPGQEPLIDRVRRAFAETPREAASAISDEQTREAVIAHALHAIPEEWRPATLERLHVTSDQIARRFVAAHAFANWTAHTGHGLRTWWRSLDAALTLLEAGLGVRQADLLLRHLADPRALSDEWSRYEVRPG